MKVVQWCGLNAVVKADDDDILMDEKCKWGVILTYDPEWKEKDFIDCDFFERTKKEAINRARSW